MTPYPYKKIFSVLTLIAILCIGAHISFAADAMYQTDNTYTPLAPLPDLKTDTPATSVNFADYAQYVFNLLVALGAVAAVFMITWGGFDYMTFDSIEGKKEGREKIKNAIYGLIIILASVLIVRTINPQFGNVPAGLVPSADLGKQDNATSLLLEAFNNAVLQQTENANRNAAITDAAALTLINNLNQQITEAGNEEAKACDQSLSTYSAQNCALAANKREILQDSLSQAQIKQVATAFTAASASYMGTIQTHFISTEDSTDLVSSYNQDARTKLNQTFQQAVALANNDPAVIQNLQMINGANNTTFSIEDTVLAAANGSINKDVAIRQITDYQSLQDNKLKRTQNPSTGYVDAVNVVDSFAAASIQSIKNPRTKITRPGDSSYTPGSDI